MTSRCPYRDILQTAQTRVRVLDDPFNLALGQIVLVLQLGKCQAINESILEYGAVTG